MKWYDFINKGIIFVYNRIDGEKLQSLYSCVWIYYLDTCTSNVVMVTTTVNLTDGSSDPM